jgi:hypothetical protein
MRRREKPSIECKEISSALHTLPPEIQRISGGISFRAEKIAQEVEVLFLD